ncbi:MAG TPA: ATP-binding protein [Vicinamibacterales bacterium]|nr:ATP-binding protein [Vicinamibacterales bacterium]
MSDVAVRLGYTSADRSNESFRQTFGLAAIVALAIYLSSQAGFLLRLPQSGIGFVWPPNAVLFVAFLLVPQSWAVVLGAALVGHVVAHTQDGLPVAIQALSFFGNATQAWLAAWLIQRLSGSRLYLADLRTTGIFLGAAVAASSVASLVPATGYVWLGWAADFSAAWWARVLANVITMVILPPVLLLAPSALAELRQKPRRAVEFAAILAGLFLIHAIAFGWTPAAVAGRPALLYAPLPLLLWAAVRFGPFGLAAALTTVAIQWLPNARSSAGVFAGDSPAAAVVSLQAFLFVAGVPLMILAGLAQDRKRSEAALRQSEARKRAILTAIPDLMFLQSADGVYLDYHAKDPTDLLLPAHEFLGKRTEDVLPPDLAARFARAFAHATDDEPSVVRYAIPIRGEMRSYEARIARCDGDHRLTIVQDITERTRAEERLRDSERRYVLAATAARVGVWEWDVASNKIYVDPAIHADLGLRPGQVGPTLDDWLELVHAADRARIRSTLQSGSDGHATAFEYDCRVVHHDGGIRWFHVRGAVVPQDGIGPVRVSGTATDITGRKQTEEALHRAQFELARTGRAAALGELAATIAHEVDQPLCAIVANANACLRWLDDTDGGVQDIREALADVVADANRASEVVRRTRELFRHGPVETTSLEVNSVVREVLALNRARLERGQVEVMADMSDDPLLVQGNRVQLQQVVFNLVTNAVDAMRGMDRVARLEIRTWRERTSIRLSISDTGAGFSPKDAARMFDSFFTTKPDGLGMGLALTRSIVQQHRGKLWAVPRAGGGSVFHVALPMAETNIA